MSPKEEYFEEAARVFEKLRQAPPEGLDAFAEAIIETWEEGGKVVSFGNGGSATDSLHFTTELVARFNEDPIHRPAISLASSPSSLTAISNDWSFEEVFSRQVRAQVKPGDVVMGISTSGNSTNVINALRAASDRDARVFGLTGSSDCDLNDLPIETITVPANKTPHVQEAHIACLHYVCNIIDQTINK